MKNLRDSKTYKSWDWQNNENGQNISTNCEWFAFSFWVYDIFHGGSLEKL